MLRSTDTRKVLLAGICSLILTVGLARFAYTPMLPVMRAETWLTEVAGGWLATFNYMGYMSGALLAASISSLHTKYRLYRAGLVIGVLSIAGMALTQDMVLWSILRYIAGLSSAAGLLIGSGLMLNWLMRNGHRPELGIHFGGLGGGILVSGLVAVLMTAMHLNWAQQWIALGLLSALLFIPAWLWLPEPAPPANQQTTPQAPPSLQWLKLMIAMYFCAGVGFVVSATFTVAMVEKIPSLNGWGSWVWVLVGIAATPACFIWDRVSRRIGDMPALQLAFAGQIVAIVLPAVSMNAAIAVFSAALYGATFIGIVSLTLTAIGRHYPANPAKAMARLTLSYGVAQIIAPAATGYIAEATGSYQGGLLMAAAVMVVGMGLLWKLHTTPTH
ncbi:YbfB/YjiJ family MFS transporter [Thiothrix winogradskyi]|uniref:YbfB/YjiJ family MFS transporter n=1 Tax=Thiothrix winogradskyi TaxID=96472 RepID=A0ABY3SZM2_9GAMM|nr:YbfB/YjiJ family MFS transporter [Thiothrix winogradskyi]UJS25012.1 YbfB/YjiJ family MFS transporter [Thiothrix winogradskyi]